MKNPQLIYLLLLSLFAFNCILNGSKKNEPITTNDPVPGYDQIIEFTSNCDTPFNDELMANIKANYQQLYQRENELVVIKNSDSACSFCESIKSRNQELRIKYFDTLIYKFDRARCNEKQVSKKIKNIVLTANLVSDTNLQKEYIAYHATQFEKWPDIARGFCNADFQGLVVLKNGRRLMLIITIPENKTLDELNPKTTENNPKMVEWNNLMKKYQEGIPGTKPGEVWVFLKPI